MRQASSWFKLYTRDEISRFESMASAGSQVAITTSGILTITPSATDPVSLLNPSFGRGMLLKAGAYEGTIRMRSTDELTAKVFPVPAAIVTVTNYELLWPKMVIGPFAAAPIEAGGQTRPVTGPLSSQIILLPEGALPDEEFDT